MMKTHINNYHPRLQLYLTTPELLVLDDAVKFENGFVVISAPDDTMIISPVSRSTNIYLTT